MFYLYLILLVPKLLAISVPGRVLGSASVAVLVKTSVPTGAFEAMENAQSVEANTGLFKFLRMLTVTYKWKFQRFRHCFSNMWNNSFLKNLIKNDSHREKKIQFMMCTAERKCLCVCVWKKERSVFVCEKEKERERERERGREREREWGKEDDNTKRFTMTDSDK